MAVTKEGAQLTEAHRLAQYRLGAATANDVVRTFGLLDPARLDATFPTYERAFAAVTKRGQERSALLAATYFEEFRKAENAPGVVTARLAAPLKRERIETVARVTGPVMVKRSLLRSVPETTALQRAAAEAAASSLRLVLEGGRETLIGSVARDKAAEGWARVASGNACAFCAMLASRGPVYSEESGDFEAHSGCGCGVEVVYGGDSYQWPETSSRYRDLWETAHTDVSPETPGPLIFRHMTEGKSYEAAVEATRAGAARRLA